MNPRFKSKTYWAALLLSILAIVEVQQGAITEIVPESLRPYMFIVFPIAMLLCREVTTTALSEK